MKKMELEVKILDIDKAEFITKIKSLGATLKVKQNNFSILMIYLQYMADLLILKLN